MNKTAYSESHALIQREMLTYIEGMRVTKGKSTQ